MDRIRVYICVYKSTNQESLFYQKDNDTYHDLRLEEDDFKDIVTGERYERPFRYEVGDIYISTDQLRPAANILGISSPTIQKKKLLEKYREYKRR